MPPKQPKTPNSKYGSPAKRDHQQSSQSPSSQALIQLRLNPANGQITFYNQTFANFDDLMRHIQNQSPVQQEKFLHLLLSQMLNFREAWTDQILRFADYFDSEYAEDVFRKVFSTPEQYEERWGVLQLRIEGIRDERKRIQPLVRKVIERCPAASKDFYQEYFQPYGETRVTMDKLGKWLAQPGENLTEKIRLIHNAAVDRCLNRDRKGGHSDS